MGVPVMNVSSVRPETVFIFVALAAAGWMLSKVFDKFGDAVKPATDAIGDALAAVIVPPPAQLTPTYVQLPDGARINFQDVIRAGGSLQHVSGEIYTFTYLGKRYRMITPRLTPTMYAAVLA